MQPLHDLLTRIRRDREFGRGEFWLGYWNRVAQEIVRIPPREAIIGEEDRFSFTVTGPDGERHRIPLRRVRRIWRDGEPVWSRDP